MVVRTVLLAWIFQMGLMAIPRVIWAQTALTEHMVIRHARVVSTEISPDGQTTAFLKSIVNGRRLHELWVVDHRTKQSRALVSSPVSVSACQWSKDGRYLYFSATLKDHSEKPQLYRIPLEGGAVERVTFVNRPVKDFEVSPDGGTILFTDEAPFDPQAPVVNEYSLNFTYLYAYHTHNATTVQINPDSLHVIAFGWAPAGGQLIFQATRSASADHEYMFSDLYLAGVREKNGQILCKREGKLEKFFWSPNGRYVAYRGGVDLHDPTEGSLFVTEARVGSTPRNLTLNFRGSVEHAAWLDSATLVFSATVRSHSELWTVDLDGATQLLNGEKHLGYAGFSLQSGTGLLSLPASSYSHPADVFAFDTEDRTFLRLTTSNPAFDSVSFSPVEEIGYKAQDGLEITGLLVKPVAFDERKKYPLVVYVHGGPESAETVGWNNSYIRWTQLLAQEGCAVFSPNYRGSTGRGVAFAKSSHRDPMGKDFQDVLDGIKYLVSQGWVDPKRVGITGGSYGGYATAWAATKHSEHFSAAVMLVGTTNQISKSGTTDAPFENALVHMKQWLYDDDYSLAWDRSPLRYARNARTPLLIAHGDRDKRVPVGQSYELYRALRHFGHAPCELVVYPGEGHGNRRPENQADFLQRGLAWMRKYLKF
jgi:dipeptidyl aminopeptidase/acylaminoacyl peptidase